MVKICPVCGYDKLDLIPYDEFGYPSYEICSCCGYEYGYTDSHDNETFENYRNKWLKEGAIFMFEEYIPCVWNKEVLNKQMNNILLTNFKPRILKS